MDPIVNHPFFMALYGGLFWFVLIWARGSDGERWKTKGFWKDQNDEILVSLLFASLFIVWDDESVYAFFYVKDVWIGKIDHETWEPPITQLEPFMYLLLIPLGEILYSRIKK